MFNLDGILDLDHVFCFVFLKYLFYEEYYDCNVYIPKSLGEKREKEKGEKVDKLKWGETLDRVMNE
jgi:hypothetical protein